MFVKFNHVYHDIYFRCYSSTGDGGERDQIWTKKNVFHLFRDYDGKTFLKLGKHYSIEMENTALVVFIM